MKKTMTLEELNAKVNHTNKWGGFLNLGGLTSIPGRIGIF